MLKASLITLEKKYVLYRRISISNNTLRIICHLSMYYKLCIKLGLTRFSLHKMQNKIDDPTYNSTFYFTILMINLYSGLVCLQPKTQITINNRTKPNLLNLELIEVFSINESKKFNLGNEELLYLQKQKKDSYRKQQDN